MPKIWHKVRNKTFKHEKNTYKYRNKDDIADSFAVQTWFIFSLGMVDNKVSGQSVSAMWRHKMREMRGEVGKKPLKKRWIIPHFYDVTCWFFEGLSSSSGWDKRDMKFIFLGTCAMNAAESFLKPDESYEHNQLKLSHTIIGCA